MAYLLQVIIMDNNELLYTNMYADICKNNAIKYWKENGAVHTILEAIAQKAKYGEFSYTVESDLFKELNHIKIKTIFTNFGFKVMLLSAKELVIAWGIDE